MARYDLGQTDLAIGSARFGVVVSRFNDSVVSRLLRGAVDTLAEHGVDASRVSVLKVPGAFEIPLAAQRLAAGGRVDAIIALGAVIRGGTPHFEYVAGECARGVAEVARRSDLPVIFGVLTVDDLDQALARAGGSEGNKGSEAALAAMEMVTAMNRLGR